MRTLRILVVGTGQSRDYFSEAGIAFVPIQDTSAFATCP
jgi:hypothetical protein